MTQLIDWSLTLGLWGLALLSLLSTSVFRGVVFFILLGLLLSLIWIRLDAPDIALAEAAIGAGITGVLLLDTLGHLRRSRMAQGERVWRLDRRLFLALGSSLSLACLLIWALLHQPALPVDLDQQVLAAIPDSGVAHPVTAVLLNFRSYDTLLEIGVLVLAVLVGLTLQRKLPRHDSFPALPNPLLHASLTLLAPAMLLVSAYLLWAGSSQPGGAFQAGAILAAAFILLHLAGVRLTARTSERLMKTGLITGFAVFLAVATSSIIGGRPFLTYPDQFAGALILLIELTLTLSIGLILLSLFTVAHCPTDACSRNGETR